LSCREQSGDFPPLSSASASTLLKYLGYFFNTPSEMFPIPAYVMLENLPTSLFPIFQEETLQLRVLISMDLANKCFRKLAEHSLFAKTLLMAHKFNLLSVSLKSRNREPVLQNTTVSVITRFLAKILLDVRHFGWITLRVLVNL
jgi:hypothetical protein